jgi:N-acetylmuramoyl-L-alanine amidase
LTGQGALHSLSPRRKLASERPFVSVARFVSLASLLWCVQSASQPAFASPHATRPHVVILDPGHGGEDFGTVGCGVVAEKVVALAIAEETARKLREGVASTCS